MIDTPSTGTVVWGYTVTLDEGGSFEIGYGSNTLPAGTTGSFMTSVQCGS